MRFEVGQKIVFLHESGGGIVQSISDKGRYIVEDSDGFEREFLQSEIAAVYSEEYKINAEDIRGLNDDESFSKAKHEVTQGVLTGSRKPIEVWELDLHIEEITDSHSGWSNTEILRAQMSELKTFYKKAKGRRIRKIVIIHGVGMGVLKEEVRSFFRNIDGLDVYDADFREYGKGATAVEIGYL
jgi:Smr domain